MSSPPEFSKPKPMPWVDGATRVFGVVAHPIEHVRAPMVFNPLFVASGLPHIMVPINAPPDQLKTIIEGLRLMPNFGGLAVTIPHKIALANLCDTLGTAAQLTGAVNAVRFDEDGSIHGDNFDGAGFVAGCLGNGIDVAGKDVLLIGAGGAARSIAAALCESGVRRLTIVNRSIEKANVLVELLAHKTGFNEAKAVKVPELYCGNADMIINSTSVGMKDDDPLPLPLDHARANAVIADIIMMPARTKWLIEAENAGFQTHYGQHMLDYQVELIGKFIGAL